MDLINCYINAHKNEMILIFNNNVTRTLKISNAQPQDYDLIDRGNRLFTINLHKRQINKDEFKIDGCLPIHCLDIPKNTPKVNISPVYLINCFIYIMKILFSSKCQDDKTFVRDDSGIINIPTNQEKMNDLMSKVFKSMEESKSNDDFNFNNIFHILLQQIILLEKQSVSNNVKINKSLKNASINGGIGNIHNIYDTIKNVVGIEKTLNQCADTIHHCMLNYRDDILNIVLNPNNGNFWAVKQVFAYINNDTSPLYYNLNISYKTIFSAIGEVFNALFLFIIPQYSMNESIMASFYQSAVLNELNMLNIFSDKIQLPILHRLTHSCFKTNFNDEIINKSENYLRNNHSKVLKNLKYMKDLQFHDNILLLCKIAAMSNISDSEYTNSLYYLLNETQSRSVAFYLVLLATIYIQSKCLNLSKENKISNAQKFIEPLHKIINLFGNYVKKIGLEHVLNDETFNAFNELHKNELQEATAKFVSVIPNIIS